MLVEVTVERTVTVTVTRTQRCQRLGRGDGDLFSEVSSTNLITTACFEVLCFALCY